MSASRWATAAISVTLALATGFSAAGAFAGCQKPPAPLYARMTVDLYRANAPEELASGGEVGAGQSVGVVSTDGAWTQVETDGITGWLPSWYLTVSRDDVLDESEPYVMFTKSEADLRLTPEPSAQPVRRLGPGRIVLVKGVFGDQAYVGIRVGGIPDVQRGWVPVSALGARSEVKPVEADLPAGTRVYCDDLSTPPDATATGELTIYDQDVTIMREDGPWAMVSAPGGWVAWVKTADLRYPETGPE